MGHLERGKVEARMAVDASSFDFEDEIDAKDAAARQRLRVEGNTSSESAATRGRHSVVCKHWLRNLCMKGDRCDFLHQFDLSRMPECVFWLKTGKCNDPDCGFRHVEPSQRPECQRYRMGFCRYGPMCRMRHDRMRPDEMPEVFPDWFLEQVIDNCNLVPKADDCRLERRDRNGFGTELALVPSAPSTEEGTIPGLLPPIHGKCRYFVIRSMNVRNVQISAAKGIWATSVGNSQKLRQSFNAVDHVILIFSATESRQFQGYAKMLCEPDDQLFQGIWGDLSCRLGANFRVHWIKQCSVPLSQADHIKNPQNDDLPVRRCRDGQELPSSVGERLCRFLWQQSEVDLLKGTALEFEPRVSYEYPSGLALKEDGPGPGFGRNGDGQERRANFLCMQGHPLQVITPRYDWTCSSCRAHFTSGTKLWECRTCKLELCERCSNKGNANAPLALEDSKGAAERAEAAEAAERAAARPAPAKLGSFDQGANWKEGLGKLAQARREAKSVNLGKAVAAGSSSLLGPLIEEHASRSAEEARNRPPNGGPGGAWPPPPGWRGYPPPPGHHGYLPPGHFPPPHGYFQPPGGPGQRGPYGEAAPPGYWGGAGPPPGFAQPPADWQGQSPGAAPAPRARSRGEKDRHKRSRSPRKAHRKRHKQH